MDINCPKCNGKAPEKVHGEKLQKLNKCKECEGLWFDQGEMALFGNTDFDIPDMHEKISKGEVTKYRCPKCPKLKLIEMPYMNDSVFSEFEVHLDFCISCCGVFVDKDEVDKVVKLAEAKKLNYTLADIRKIR